MALLTMNVLVSSILTVLGKAGVKDIFRNTDGSLKSENELWAVVNKWGLSSYCPGATATQKLSNLLIDRKLSYFKGYDHNTIPFSLDSYSFPTFGGTITNLLTCLSSEYEWWFYDRSATWFSYPQNPASGVGSNSYSITAQSNLGESRQGILTLRGLPKLYGADWVYINIDISQVGDDPK